FGIYEYRNRAYHPGLGRFMSEDPKLFVRGIGMGKSPDDWSFAKHPDEAELNLFRYCHNDPLDKTDPMGLYWLPMTKEEKKAYDTAKQRLQGSPTAKRLLDRIEKSRTGFKL